MKKITKVVIPVAGKGTRFLPITKTISKTLLPIIDKPVIHRLIEEAVDAGIEEALIIVGPSQNDVLDYFDLSSDYVNSLTDTYQELIELSNLLKKIKIKFAIQELPKGLGDAVKLAKDFVGSDDFALILGDDFVDKNDEDIYGIHSLCKNYEKINTFYIGVKEVDLIETKKYGIVSPLDSTISPFKIIDMVEKPQDNPPSKMACVGRYILKNSIFNYLDSVDYITGKELQLTDAIALAIKNDEEVYASTFKGIRFDIGSKKGYVDAIVKVSKNYF